MAERRRFKRVYARLKIWCEGEDFTLLAQSANVSAGGLFVQASSMPPQTARMRVTIQELGAVAEAETRWSCGTADAHRSRGAPDPSLESKRHHARTCSDRSFFHRAAYGAIECFDDVGFRDVPSLTIVEAAVVAFGDNRS